MRLFSYVTAKAPGSLGRKLAPLGEKLDLAFSDQGARSVAARAALFIFTVRVLAAIVAYGGQVVLARMLGAYDYGIYAIIWVWVVVLSTFCGFGFPTGLLRFIPQLQQEDRIAELRAVMVKGVAFNITLCTLLSGAGVTLLLTMPQLVDNAFLIPLILAAFCLPMMTLVDNQDGIAQAFNWPDLVTLPPFLIRPLFILVLFVAMTFAGIEATATSAMIATLVGVYLVTLVQLWVLHRRVVKKIGKGPMEGPIAPWLKAALPMLVVEGFFFLIINTDIMVAGLFIAPDEVAVYYAAAKTLALVHFVAFAIRVATSHKIAEYHASNDKVMLDHTLADTLRWTFWPSLAIAAALMWQGDLVLSFFGDGFEDGMTFLTILLIGVLIRASVGPAESMLTMANAQKTAAWVYGLVFAVNLSLNFILIPTVGLIGAAMATALSMTVEAVLLVIMVRRHLGVTSFIGLAGRLTAEATP